MSLAPHGVAGVRAVGNSSPELGLYGQFRTVAWNPENRSECLTDALLGTLDSCNDTPRGIR